MARALTPAEILATHKKWGCPVNQISGWKTRSNGNPWGAVVGCMDHHTAMDSPDSVNIRVLRDGRPGLRGPLCNFGVGDDGVIDIIAAGPANHAGGGDPKILAKVQAESYAGNLKPTKHASSPGSVGGNSRFYGWETYYGAGKDKTIDAIQYRALVLSNAAMVDALDSVDGPTRWTGKSVIGHKEWTDHKPDPAGVVMADLRDDVDWCLEAGPVAAARWYRTGSRTAPTPTKPPAPAGGKELPTMLFYQLAGHADPKVAAAVIVTNGFQMRWVADRNARVRLFGGVHDQIGKDPNIIGVADLGGIALEWVGPLPTPTFPIPAGVKVVTQ